MAATGSEWADRAAEGEAQKPVIKEIPRVSKALHSLWPPQLTASSLTVTFSQNCNSYRSCVKQQIYL